MQTEISTLAGASPGTSHSLRVLRFGRTGARPKVMIQAALHADEVPAMLVAQCLREQLRVLEAAGSVNGEVVLVPCANPIGLSQRVLGQHHGRFDLRDGINFNRGFADLSGQAIDAVAARLGDDAVQNVAAVRAALRDAAAVLTGHDPATDLKNRLLRLAVDSDIVLDLHCDAEAVVHLYGLTPQAADCAELGALLGAEAVLLATESGDSPFDEACSRPWLAVRQRLQQHPLPLACFSTTIELRGQADTDHAMAARDARQVIEFLRRRGIVGGHLSPLPPARCAPTPLAGSEPLTAPCSGVVVFHRRPGDRVEAGDAVADIVDVDDGTVHTLRARSSGLLYARVATRWALQGQRLAKIAGRSLQRTGKLLSD